MKAYQFYLTKIERIKSRHNKKVQELLNKIERLEQINEDRQKLIILYDRLNQVNRQVDEETSKYVCLINKAHQRAYGSNPENSLETLLDISNQEIDILRR